MAAKAKKGTKQKTKSKARRAPAVRRARAKARPKAGFRIRRIAAGRRRLVKPKAKPKKAPARAARPKAAKPKAAKPKARTVRPPIRRVAAARPRTLGKPSLDRSRRVLSEDERLETAMVPPSASTERMARSGHDHLKAELERHNDSGPRLTAGDVDAKWQDAYAVGDEAPGGDNPTPDQDRVDDIGRALGIQYQDDQELQGGDEVTERDRHRWELDPASSEDWPHDKNDED